ncbi:MAG: aminoacyl-tRNA hydrolase [Phycisphaerae bacterium]|nr:aminoacyl-tRNA hydrolase [Phycisphaerae bacterium]
MGGVELAPGVTVPEQALSFTFTTSTGPGGQNVNKRATRCVLRIALADLPLHPEAVERLRHAAGHRVTDAGDLVISGGRERTQERNRDDCLARLRELLVAAMVRPKTRRRTRPTRGSKERRLSSKKRRGEIKRSRRSPE